MTRAKIFPALAALCLVAAVCSRNPSPDVSQQSGFHNGRWSGTFQPQRSRVGGLAPTNRRATYGTASILRAGRSIS